MFVIYSNNLRGYLKDIVQDDDGFHARYTVDIEHAMKFRSIVEANEFINKMTLTMCEVVAF